MKKIVILTAIAAALTVPALAQEAKPAGVSVRVGLFMPTDSNARKAGKNWFAGGIEYKLGDLKFGQTAEGYSAQSSLSLDFMSKGDYRNVPILWNYVGRTKDIYYSAGVGPGFAKLPKTGGGTESKTVFSYAFGVGYELSKQQMPVFIEARYNGSSKSELNGFGVYLGVRF